MKITSWLTALFLSLTAVSLFGGQTTSDSTASENTGPIVETQPSLPFEFHAEATYVGDGDVRRGSLRVEDFDETDGTFRFILTPGSRWGFFVSAPNMNAIPLVFRTPALCPTFCNRPT